MDNTLLSLRTFTLLNIIRRIKLRMNLAIADIFSIEQERILELIANMHPNYKHKLLHLPNAFGGKAIAPLSFAKKKNIIVTVGPVGAKQKATDIILNVAERLDLRNWKLIMIGAVLEEYKGELDEFFKRNPQLKDKVIIKGHIGNREEMMRYLREAKIIFMPSRWETFSLALCEAAYYGTVIVATPVGGASELTQKGTIGSLCGFEDVNDMVGQLKKRMKNQRLLEKESTATRKFCKKNYTWETIIVRLYTRILSARDRSRP
jgi:glycosyltransferase involved in cell wall biosynthesis